MATTRAASHGTPAHPLMRARPPRRDSAMSTAATCRTEECRPPEHDIVPVDAWSGGAAREAGSEVWALSV
jgi:hypothetical protein